jgi:hypothetical protein
VFLHEFYTKLLCYHLDKLNAFILVKKKKIVSFLSHSTIGRFSFFYKKNGENTVNNGFSHRSLFLSCPTRNHVCMHISLSHSHAHTYQSEKEAEPKICCGKGDNGRVLSSFMQCPSNNKVILETKKV